MTAAGTSNLVFTARIQVVSGNRAFLDTVRFGLLPDGRTIANTGRISVGPVRAGDKVLLELLSRDDIPRVVATAEIPVHGTGDGVIEPGKFKVELGCTCCCEEECTCNEPGDDE